MPLFRVCIFEYLIPLENQEHSSQKTLRGTPLLAQTWAKNPTLTGLFFICSGIKMPPLTVNLKTLYHKRGCSSIAKSFAVFDQAFFFLSKIQNAANVNHVVLQFPMTKALRNTSVIFPRSTTGLYNCQ